MKLIAHNFLLFLSLLFYSCKNDGGGVISTSSQPPTPTVVTPDNDFYGPFGGPINNDEVIPLASPFNPPLTTYDLDQLINNVNSGETLILEDDINFNYSLLIEKPIKLFGSSQKRVKLSAKNLLNLIQSDVNNVVIENFDIYLYNVESFIISPVNNVGKPTKSFLKLKNNRIFLSGKSSAKILFNNLILENNSFFGLSSNDRNFPILDITGDNIDIKGNFIIDNTLKYLNTLSLLQVSNANIDSNVIVAYAKGYFASITLRQSSDINISNNILYDRNSARIKNDGYSIDPNVDGSIAISIQESTNVYDQNSNSYFATHSLITDMGNNIGNGVVESSNITMDNFVLKNSDISPSQIFNNQSSMDFTPICLLGVNPLLTLTPNINWQSYIIQSGTELYYAGAIKPACN